MHEVNNHRLVSLQMVFPTFSACFNIVVALEFHNRHEGFVLDPVQIFVEAIEQHT
jgi:hypothetical protein